MGDFTVQYISFTRWRMGWVTFYRMETAEEIEWKLYIPFDFSFGFSLRKK